jgi:hypothetical protein
MEPIKESVANIEVRLESFKKNILTFYIKGFIWIRELRAYNYPFQPEESFLEDETEEEREEDYFVSRECRQWLWTQLLLNIL